jgi:hypothetical protein
MTLDRTSKKDTRFGLYIYGPLGDLEVGCVSLHPLSLVREKRLVSVGNSEYTRLNLISVLREK